MTEIAHLLKSLHANDGRIVVPTDADVKQIQKKLLEMLDDIMTCCEKYNISWQMSGGSALGTVRHQGFIPWDDDLDINMPRADFDRFAEVFPKEYGEKYWFHAPVLTPGYDALSSKVVRKDIRARDILALPGEENGLWVDIFIMENTPDNAFLRRIHGLGCMAFRYVLSCIRFARNREELESLLGDNPEFEAIARRRIRAGKMFLILPLRFWCVHADKWVRAEKNNRTHFISIVSGVKHYFGELYERERQCTLVKRSFNYRPVLIAKDHDGYLKNLYGDYMQLPKDNERESHLFLELDLDQLYSATKKSGENFAV